MWEQHLAIAERHVIASQHHVARQRQIVFELERDGHGATTARALLAEFKTSLKLHVEDRDRLKADLSR